MDLLLKFKEYLTQGKNQPSKVTVKNYIADLRKFIRWYETTYNRLFHPLAISPTIIQEYKTQINDVRSMKRYLSSLRKFFQYLYHLGAIPANPFDQVVENKEQESNPWKLKDFKNFLYSTKASKLTIKNYIIDIRQFLEWLKEVMTSEIALENSSFKLNESDVYARINEISINAYKKRLLSERQLSPVSINRKLSSLRRYISWLNEKNIIQKDIPIYDLRHSLSTEITEIIEPQAETTSQIQLEDLKAITSLTTKEKQGQKNYSSFPPFRLFQKSIRAITWGVDLLILLPIIQIIASGKYTFWKINGRKIFAPTNEILQDSLKDLNVSTATEAFLPITKTTINNKVLNTAKSLSLLNRFNQLRKPTKKLHVSNIPKSMYAPLKISTKNFSLPKKVIYHIRHTRPEWYKKYNSYPVVRYFQLAIFLITTTTIGFGLYQSFFESPRSQKPALAALPTAPPRILSFQGRLTDSSDTPITAATSLRFAIYNSQAASGSALVWEEQQYITPDDEGVFSALLGKKNEISQSIFSNNSSLYLGVTVGSDDELQPRQPLATVAYAANAETLQGLVPITQENAGTTNVVLALDSAGNLTIGGNASPTFEATGGTFTLSGQVLHLSTADGSNGNIQIAPDGTGIIDLQRPLQNTNGIIEINDLLSITTTSLTQPAFTINQNGTGPILSASSGGIAKFTVDNSGAGIFADSLTINGNTLRTGSSTFNLLTTNANTIYLGLATTSLSIASISGTTTINNALTVSGHATFNGGATIPTEDTITISGTVASHILPSASETYDLGSTSRYWRNEYLTNLFMSPSATTSGFWQRNNGALAPTNIGDDLLVGGTTATAAKFQIVASSGNASTAGTLTFNTTGTIQTTNNQPLTIGGNNTGNITLSPLNGIGNTLINGRVGINTASPLATFDVRGLSGTTALASLSGQTTYAGLVVNNSGSGDIFTASSSGASKFVIRQNGFVGIGTTNPLAMFDVNGSASISGNLTFNSAATIQTTANQALTLGGTTTGNILLLPQNGMGMVGIGTTNPLATIDVRGQIGTIAIASISGETTFAALSINNNGNGDLLTASSSGVTKLRIDTNGNIFPGTNGTQDIGSSTLNWDTIYSNNVIAGTLSGIQGFWQRNDSALSPYNSSDDLLLGSTATTSAKIGLINIAGGTPTATISAGTTGLALTGNGTVQSLNNNTLTIGGNTSGNIILSPLNGSGTVISTGNVSLSSGKTFQIDGADVLSASALGSGVTGSSLTSVGTLTTGTWNATAISTQYGGTGQNFSSVLRGAVPYFSNTGVMATLSTGTSGQCLVTAGAGADPAWIDCASGANSTNWWIQTNGALTPINSTVDLLFGGASSSSAKFAVLNMNSGTPTASISAQSGGSALSITPTSLTTQNAQTLTLGGSTTGHILLDSGSDSISFADAAIFSGVARFDAGATIISGQNLTFGGITGNNAVLYATSGTGITTAATTNTSNLCLTSGASTPTWATCPGSGNGASKWTEESGVIYSNNATVDLLVGGSSTASAKFAVLNINSGTPTASLSAGSTGLVLSATGSIQSVNNSTLTLGGTTTGNITISPTNGSGSLAINAGTLSINGSTGTTLGTASCVITTLGIVIGTGSCPGGSGGSNWSITNGAISPINSTVDLLIGGSSTASAKFAVLNINSDTPTASISAISTGNGVAVTGDGSIQSLRKGTLTLGGTTTGDISFKPGNAASSLYLASNGNVGIGTSTPANLLDVRSSSNTFNGGTIAVASISAQSSFAGLVVDNSGTGDIFTASSSGLPRFTVKQDGSVEIGDANLQATGDRGITINSKDSAFLKLRGDTDNAGPGGDSEIGTAYISLTQDGTANPRYLGLVQHAGFDPSETAYTGTLTNALLLGTTGNDNIQLGTNATVGFSMNGSQQIGIGTTSPLARLDIRGSIGTTPAASISAQSSFAGLVVDNKGNGDLFTASSSGLNRFVIKQDGFVGIGTKAPQAELHIADSGSGINNATSLAIENTDATSEKSQLWLKTNSAAGGWYVGTDLGATGGDDFFIWGGGSGDTRMVIDSAGNVGVGSATSLGYKFEVQDSQSSGSIANFENTFNGNNADGVRIKLGYTGTLGSSNNFISFIKGDNSQIGQIEGNGAGGIQYTTTSDIRLKENITPTHYGLDDLMKIQVKDYNFINARGTTSTGIIAQELYTIYPNAVSVGSDDLTDPWGIAYDQLTPLLIKSVQEQQNQIETLKNEVATVTAPPDDSIQTLLLSLVSRVASLEAKTATQSGSSSINQSALTNLDLKIASLEASLAFQASESAFFMDMLTNNPLMSFNATSGAELDLDKIETNEATVSGALTVLGEAKLNNVGITGTVNVGLLAISGLNNDGLAEINTIAGPLKLQSHGFFGLDILDGKITIAQNGDMNVNGNAVFTKDVKIKGKLAANIIVPVPDEDLIIQLSDSENNRHNKIAIHNGRGKEVLSMNHLGDLVASGSGKFADLATGAINIVRGVQADTSVTESVASASAGTALITTHQTERTIYSPHIKADSLIYITATSNTQGQVPYVARQTPEDPKKKIKGSFTVQIPTAVNKDIKFNWWIVN